MNKEEIITKATKYAKLDFPTLSRAEGKILFNAFLLALKSGLLNDGSLRLQGIGLFKTLMTKEREGRDPRNNNPIVIKARKVVKFKPSKLLQSELNQKET